MMERDHEVNQAAMLFGITATIAHMILSAVIRVTIAGAIILLFLR